MALTDKLVAIADAIRAKDGSTATMTLDQMPGKISAITTADNIVHADIPDYIKSAALEVAKKVRAVQTPESITFIAMSDSHQLGTNSDIVTGNLHAGMAAKTLAYIMPNIDFACFLGDYTAGSNTTTIEEGKRHFAEINADIDEAFAGIPQFRTVGNHDPLGYSYSQNGYYLDQATLYGLIGKYNDDGVTVMGSTTGGYCYRDFTDKKVRVICLNTAEMASASSGGAENMTSEQKLWFANALKEAGAKGSSWGIIVLSHHPLDWGNVLMASNIVHAYVEGESITITSGNTVNFSGSNSAKFLGAFHGHVHGFRAAKMNYIANSVGTEYQAYRIAIPNMCFLRNNEYGQNGNTEYYGIEFGENTTYNKTAETANDTAFVVNVVNPSEKKIYSFCYGAGYDREIFTGTMIIPTTGITLDQTSGTLTEGDTVTLTATVSPDNATYKTVIWETSDSTVATVADGVVTALKAGTTTITAKTADGNFSATYTLTVEAEAVNYTNLVPTSQAINSTDPYNGIGYKNGYYLSSDSPFEGKDAATVLTGYIPYTIPSTGLPKTIYIKGAAWEAISHCRMYFFTEGKGSICGPYISGNGSGNNALSKYFTIETLGNNYIKLTPILSSSGTTSMLVSTVATSTNARFVRFSLKGMGTNLIITLNEPIENGDAYTDLIAEYGYRDGYRISTSTGNFSAGAGYVAIGYPNAIPVGAADYPNGFVIEVTGANFDSSSHTQCTWAIYQGTDPTITSGTGGYIHAGTQSLNGVSTTVELTDNGIKWTFPTGLRSYTFLRFAGHGSGANLTGTITPITGASGIAVTGVTLDQTSGTLTEGDTVTLTATVSPSNASNKSVTWETSDSSVATVANGVVTAIKPGTATITVKTADGGFTASYTLTVESQVIDLLATYGYADNTRLSTGNGGEKEQADYVTVGHTAPIPIDKTRYPNGAIIRVTGAVNCLGNNYAGTNNGGNSAWVLYVGDGTKFSTSSYIENKTGTVGTIMVDDDKTGFTLDIASLSAPHYLKFCVRGVGANITATLTPK